MGGAADASVGADTGAGVGSGAGCAVVAGASAGVTPGGATACERDVVRASPDGAGRSGRAPGPVAATAAGALIVVAGAGVGDGTANPDGTDAAGETADGSETLGGGAVAG